ncbi:MAG: hypothetical protein GC179_21550 [Anaerolineaceae bacterium]|nr:hypothetical protein [Anaerolineaceae bacterium]
MQSLKRALPLNLAIYGLYLAAALLITWPLLTVISTHFAGYPFGDAHEMTRHIWWMKHALQTGQPLFFQPLLAYPDGIQGVILWSDPLQFFPGWLFAFFMPLPAAYNLFVLLTLALNGWAAYWLVWKLTDVRSSALLGGLTFMTAPVIQGHLAGGHGGLLVQWPLPLLTYSLLQVTSGRFQVVSRQSPVTSDQPRRYILLAIFFFVLTPFGHTLQLIYAVLPLMAVIGITVIVRRDWWALLRLFIVGMVGLILLVIFLLPVFTSTFGTSAYTAEGGGVEFSADLLGIVTPSFNHPLYGQLDYTHKVLGVNIVEGSSYVGLIAGLLALLALWKVKKARWWLALAIVLWILSLGPLLKVFDHPLKINLGEYETYLTLPYALIYNLPGFSLARAPGRFDFLLALVVAVLVGYGWAWISGKLQAASDKSNASRQSPVTSQKNSSLSTFSSLGTRYSVLGTMAIGLLILLDYQSFWPLPTYDATIPQAVYDLAKRDDVRAVYDVPWDNLLAAKDALWLQTAHQKPMIAGQVTRRTPVSPAKLTILEQTMNPALLKEAGVDVVIVHKFYDKDGKLAANARKMLGEPFYENDLLALFEVKPITQPELVVTSAGGTITDTKSSYVYAPQTGWLQLYLLGFADNREVSLSFDGQVLHRWSVTSDKTDNDLSIKIPITTTGYHTLTWALEPPCRAQFDTTLICRQLMLFDPFGFSLNDYVFQNGIQFDGVQLLASRFTGSQFTSTFNLDLLWQFDRPFTEQDIRFIKILDNKGQEIYAKDEPLGSQPKDNQWLESVAFNNSLKLPAGEYKVYVGWYTYPDITRFKVLSDVPGAVDNWAQIGSFTVSPQ